MDMQPSAFPTGSAGPLGHDYWKRAVYRAAPRHFTVEMLSPTKLGGGSSYSYGIRVHPLQAVMSSGSTIRSSVPMSSSYEIWRKWEDCLWFQDTLELQYSTLSRQKRARLQSGKGVKKNGVYIQDQASSWESLPPGPDPKSVKKDVHDYLPKLTKRGTLFRTSASTIEQRNAELTALVTAFLADDVPTLIDELREDRTLRDFFGYWRRDHDLLIKSNPVRRSDPGKPRKSNVSSVAPWPILTGSMSTIDAYASVPPSPTRSTSSFAPGSNTSGPASSESSSSASSDAPPSSPTGTQMSPARTFSRSPQSEASFTTSSSRIVPNMNVVTIPPTSHEADLVSQTHSRSSAPSSRPRSHSAPQKPKSYNVSEDFPLFLSESSREPQPRPAPPGTVRARVGGLEALPEEQEQETVESSRDVENAGPSTPQVSTTPFLLRRPRAQSLAASSHCTATVCDEAFTNLEPTDDSSSAHDTPWSGHESDPDPGLSSSSATLSTLSLQSRRSSWRAGTRSRPSSSESTGSATSGIDVDLSGFLTDPSPTPSARRHSHRSKASIATVDSAEAIIPGRSSLASPTRHRRARSDPKAFPSGVEDGGVGIDSWMVLGDDFMDAYFDHQPPGSDLELDVAEEDVSQELAIPERSLDVPFTAVPSTPYDPAAHDDGSAAQIVSVPETPTPDVPSTAVPPTPGTLPQLAGRRQQVAISLSPELFSQPFRASSTSGLQFHLPFTPSPNNTPELSFFPPSPAQPAFLSTPPADDAVVVKAALDDSIVSFRLPRCTPLVDARMRVADKFSHTEGLELSPGFAIAYVPPVGSRASARETLVRASTTSAATTDWSRQAWIETEEDWSVAVATCGPKLVLRVACPTPA